MNNSFGIDTFRRVDRDYCASSYLAFRYIVDDNIDFKEDVHHRIYKLIDDRDRVLVKTPNDIDEVLIKRFDDLKTKRLGILLSGGMDSGILASYMKGQHAYTFRFLGGNFQKDELERAEKYAKISDLELHYVDIDWDVVRENVDPLMKNKGAPVHSIEPQVMQAALQAKKDGIETMIIGDAADYVFGGMDGLHAKDWKYEEFKKRYIYIDPELVLNHPVDMNYAFEKYRIGQDGIDYISFMHEYTDIESYASYDNAFNTAEMSFVDPYEIMKMADPLDLNRIRNGESKYLIRELFKIRYPELTLPEKKPMPRPVDEYFKCWSGPVCSEFRKDIDISLYSGNQKWMLWCLERYLNNIEQ